MGLRPVKVVPPSNPPRGRPVKVRLVADISAFVGR